MDKGKTSTIIVNTRAFIFRFRIFIDNSWTTIAFVSLLLSVNECEYNWEKLSLTSLFTVHFKTDIKADSNNKHDFKRLLQGSYNTFCKIVLWIKRGNLCSEC